MRRTARRAGSSGKKRGCESDQEGARDEIDGVVKLHMRRQKQTGGLREHGVARDKEQRRQADTEKKCCGRVLRESKSLC